MSMIMFSPLDMRPPKLIDLMESIVNFDREDEVKLSEISKYARLKIFNFSYPLSNKVNKEDFETMILNRFINRRIGFETFSLFKIQLNVRLNEIMPVYNKMFDMLDGWDIFNDGEITERELIEEGYNITETTGESTTSNESETETHDIADRRYSDTPQDRIEEIQNGEYMSDYNYNQDNRNSSDTSNATGTTSGLSNNENFGNKNERIVKNQGNKLELYQKFIENRNHIYTMIFKDLEQLFYQLL